MQVEIRLFHEIMRKGFQGPTHGRVWCGKLYSAGNRSCPWVSNVPSPSVPPWKKYNGVLSKTKTKASIQSKAYSFRAHANCCGPRYLLDLHGHVVPGERAHKLMSGHGSQARERERAALFSWDCVSLGLGWIRCFFKITNLLSKLSWAF